jgi:hypothetical protein
VRGKTSQRTLCSRRRHRPLILRVRKEESSRACARQKTMPKNTKIKIYNILKILSNYNLIIKSLLNKKSFYNQIKMQLKI